MGIEDGFSNADLVYQWKAAEDGSTKSAVGVSKETTSIKFVISAVNTRKETEQMQTSKALQRIISISISY